MNLLLDKRDGGEALLALSDGTVLSGRSCGAAGETFGRLVCVRDIFGYQAELESERNRGAVLAFTYPQMGNYGMRDVASAPAELPAVGVIVHDMIYTPSSWTSEQSLPDYLVEHGVVAIEDVDMRALAQRLRDAGELACAISTTETDGSALLARLAQAASEVM